MNNDLDFTGVLTDWLNDDPVLASERRRLLSQAREAIVHSPKTKILLAELAQKCIDQRLDPVNGLALALNYGVALGALLEQERRDRRRIVA